MAIIIANATKSLSKNSFTISDAGDMPVRERWDILVQDGQTYDYQDLENATNLPKRGQFYEETNSKVTHIDFDPDEDNDLRWIATVNYAPLQINLSQIASDLVAKNRLISLRQGTAVTQETIDGAYFVTTVKKSDTISIPSFSTIKERENDTPIQNTAKTKIVGVSEPVYNKVVFLTQIEVDGFDPELASDLMGHPNIDAITIGGVKFKEQEGLIINMDIELMNPSQETFGFPDGKYYKTAYTVQRKKGGWYNRVINDGFQQFKGGVSTAKQDIINSDVGIDVDPNEPIQEPALLSLNGSVEEGNDVFYQVIWAKFPKKWSTAIDFVEVA